MTSPTNQWTDSTDARVDDLRRQLRSLGYLDAGVDRFVLGPANSGRRPWAIGALAALRIGLIAGSLLGPAAALGVGVRLPGLITGPRDALVVALYFAVLFGLAAAIVSFAASVLVALVPVGRFTARARLVSRSAGTLVGAASLIYLTLWWRIATPESGTFSLAWTLGALAIAAAISLLLGHVTAITAFAMMVARGGAVSADQPRSAKLLTAGAALSAFIGALALLLLIAPEQSTAPERPVLAVVSPGLRVKVFAIDGFDPAVLETLRTQGQTPTFARLLSNGAIQLTGTDVADPARAWTTVATGQPPDVHGVHGLETRRVAGLQGSLAAAVPPGLARTLRGASDLLRLTRPAIASGSELRVKTFWEVAAEAGLRAAVVNWWATWPADASGPNPPIVVSDRATLRLERGGRPEGEIAPAPIYERLAAEWPAIKTEVTATVDALLPANADPETNAVLRRAAEIDAVQLAMISRLQAEAVDLLAVYLPGLDIVQHTLLGSTSAATASALSARLEGVRSYYEYLDALLRDVTVPTPADLVMVVTHPGRIHGGSHGLLMTAGAGRAEGVTGRGRPIDLAPTVLYALGVPSSRELAGAPLLGVFSADFVKQYPVRQVESYGPRRAPAVQGRPMDQEMLERLRSLGYVR